MAWSKIDKAPLSKSEKRRETPDGLWKKCESCHHIAYQRDFESNQNVCLKCEKHYAISAEERLRHLLDADSFVEHDKGLYSTDPLQFKDSKTYAKRLEETKKKTGRLDTIVAGEGTLIGRRVQLVVFDFSFMGGSMGAVAGEKIARAILRARDKGQAVLIFSSSGGARMHEGILSLMQMAKTCAALAQLRDAGLPLISIMTNPTTGGVAASYAMLGDINIGEPGALIGFAGPRVIEQTMRQKLPEGFQTAEYLLVHGMLDLILKRYEQRERIASILDILMPAEAKSLKK